MGGGGLMEYIGLVGFIFFGDGYGWTDGDRWGKYGWKQIRSGQG